MDGLRARRRVMAVAGAAAALVIAAVAAPASAAPSASPGRHAIAGSTPTWLSRAKNLGATPSNDQITFGVLLDMRNTQEAVATLQRISDPGGPDYGRWLTNNDFNSRFAPTASDVTAVQDWLRAEGFRIVKILPSGMYIEASGTTTQVDNAFGTTVKDYSYQGKTVHANANALSLPSGTPSDVVALVGGVLGIDQGAQLHKPADLEPGPASGSRTAEPCSDYYGQKIAEDQPAVNGRAQSYDVCGYGPQQLQSAYGESTLLNKGVDGRGVTVAIVDPYASPTMPGDADKYSETQHQPTFRPGQFRQITPPPNGFDLTAADECDAQDTYGEETLDVEATHAMAPGANIVYVAAADCELALDNSWAETIDSHRADIVSNSWGSLTDDPDELGQDVQFYSQFGLEAALTGITVNFASGDSGDSTAGGTQPAARTVDFPADVPYVTGVGGTSLAVGKDGRREFEYGWQTEYSSPNDDNSGWGTPAYSSGGGGGTSAIFPQPFYQKGRVSAADSQFFGPEAMRTVPDISAVADPNTGFKVGQTQVFPEGTHWDTYRLGGTSVSSPVLSGIIAVADQNARAKLGFANPLYYRMLKTPAIDDITTPAKPVTQVRADYLNGLDARGGTQFGLETIDTQSTTIHDRPGYDTESGVGAPDGPRFFDLRRH